MKYFKSLSTAVAIAAFTSQISSADPVVLSENLDLIGFSGGNCNITVNPTSAASSLNLDAIDSVTGTSLRALVGTVNTQCDYDYRLTVTSNTVGFGARDFALTNRSDSQTFVQYQVEVDGLSVSPPENSNESIGSYSAGTNLEMPVEVEFLFKPSSPGIYTGSLTFNVIVD